MKGCDVAMRDESEANGMQKAKRKRGQRRLIRGELD
jgi:hypothetical protein